MTTLRTCHHSTKSRQLLKIKSNKKPNQKVKLILWSTQIIIRIQKHVHKPLRMFFRKLYLRLLLLQCLSTEGVNKNLQRASAITYHEAVQSLNESQWRLRTRNLLVPEKVVVKTEEVAVWVSLSSLNSSRSRMRSSQVRTTLLGIWTRIEYLDLFQNSTSISMRKSWAKWREQHLSKAFKITPCWQLWKIMKRTKMIMMIR